MELYNVDNGRKTMQIIVEGHKVKLTFAEQCNTMVPSLVMTALLESYARNQTAKS